jgi:hypothetical protein
MKKLPIKANYGKVIAKGTFFKTYFDGNPIRSSHLNTSLTNWVLE